MFNEKMINKIVEFLMNGDEGDYIENNGRVVEITNMCGGRYLFIENGLISGQADQEHYAIRFLEHGGYVNEKYAGTTIIC